MTDLRCLLGFHAMRPHPDFDPQVHRLRWFVYKRCLRCPVEGWMPSRDEDDTPGGPNV